MFPRSLVLPLPVQQVPFAAPSVPAPSLSRARGMSFQYKADTRLPLIIHLGINFFTFLF